MVRFISITLLTLLILPNLTAQEKQDIGKTGILRAQGTISFGRFTSFEQNTVYLNGTLEYYTHKHFSIRGDVFHFFRPSDASFFERNHQMVAGVSYHMIENGPIDPYLGLQAGFHLTELASDYIPIDYNGSTTSLSPNASLLIGFNYYAANWFHLFVDGRYIMARYLSPFGQQSLNELRLSFGLGFHIHAK